MRTSIVAGTIPLVPGLCFAQHKSVRDNDGADRCPKIVYIMADDHACQAVGAYGHPIARLAPTPNIDRLAHDGIVSRESFVVHSISASSRATLLTGMYSYLPRTADAALYPCQLGTGLADADTRGAPHAGRSLCADEPCVPGRPSPGA